MTEYHPRLFHADTDVVHIGEGLVARTLPRPEWTHEAHLAATTYLCGVTAATGSLITSCAVIPAGFW